MMVNKTNTKAERDFKRHVVKKPFSISAVGLIFILDSLYNTIEGNWKIIGE